jgi:hypothetical protein
LRRRIWIPALKKAGLDYREMKQTRHTEIGGRATLRY